MARATNKMTAAGVKALTKPGRHSDGGGLYLQVEAGGSRSWVFMWKRANKRVAMGLGSSPTLSLADARTKAQECRQQLSAGLDPLKERERSKAQEAQGYTFRQIVTSFLDDQRLASWRNDKHKAQWAMTLGESYCKAILDLPIDKIGTAEVLKVIKPIWQSKAETASRLRGRIERVLAFAEAQGWRPEGKNPAQWKNGLDAILPKRQKLTRGHHKALAYDGVPAFMDRLGGSKGRAARALQFLILTAARSGEVIGARWDEIDLERHVWIVPKERMKAGREHRVPLSAPAIEILNTMTLLRHPGDGGFVFGGQKKGKPVSASAMEMLLRRMKAKNEATVHGFRSAFRDWAGNETSHPREIAEAALAHAVGDQTERAYRRSDALERRRHLMDAWAKFCTSTESGKVVPFTGQKVEGAGA